jgi:hypothetical protein
VQGRHRGIGVGDPLDPPVVEREPAALHEGVADPRPRREPGRRGREEREEGDRREADDDEGGAAAPVELRAAYEQEEQDRHRHGDVQQEVAAVEDAHHPAGRRHERLQEPLGVEVQRLLHVLHPAAVPDRQLRAVHAAVDVAVQVSGLGVAEVEQRAEQDLEGQGGATHALFPAPLGAAERPTT